MKVEREQPPLEAVRLPLGARADHEMDGEQQQLALAEHVVERVIADPNVIRLEDQDFVRTPFRVKEPGPGQVEREIAKWWAKNRRERVKTIVRWFNKNPKLGSAVSLAMNRQRKVDHKNLDRARRRDEKMRKKMHKQPN